MAAGEDADGGQRRAASYARPSSERTLSTMEPSWTVPVTAEGSSGVNRKWLRGETTVCKDMQLNVTVMAKDITGNREGNGPTRAGTTPAFSQTLSDTHQIIRPIVASDLSCKVLHEGHAAPACRLQAGIQRTYTWAGHHQPGDGRVATDATTSASTTPPEPRMRTFVFVAPGSSTSGVEVPHRLDFTPRRQACYVTAYQGQHVCPEGAGPQPQGNQHPGGEDAHPSWNSCTATFTALVATNMRLPSSLLFRPSLTKAALTADMPAASGDIVPSGGQLPKWWCSPWQCARWRTQVPGRDDPVRRALRVRQ